MHLDSLVSSRTRCRARTAQTGHLSRPCSHQRNVLVSGSSAGAAAVGHRPNHRWWKGGTFVISAGFPFLLQSFFTDRLFRQRRASPHTIASSRDSFRLVLRFANQRLGKAPSNLTLDDLTVPFIGDFLDSLETGRKNSARTRNIRLAAIHSFF